MGVKQYELGTQSKKLEFLTPYQTRWNSKDGVGKRHMIEMKNSFKKFSSCPFFTSGGEKWAFSFLKK